MPRLYDRRMRALGTLQPLACRIRQTLAPCGAAELVIPPDGPEVSIGDFVRLYAIRGDLGCWRVSMIEKETGDHTRITLEHGLSTLADGLLWGTRVFDGRNTGGATGGSGDSLLATGGVIAQMLAEQPTVYWAADLSRMSPSLRTMEKTWEFNDLDILSALQEMVRQSGRVYDFCYEMGDGLPWLFWLEEPPEGFQSVARPGRNCLSLRITEDAAGLCTRLYPTGAGDGAATVTIAAVNDGRDYLTAETVSEYGRIEARWRDPDATTPEALLESARKELARRCRPALTVEIDAVDLSRLTGLAPDSFAPGQVCRVAAPSGGVIREERIVSVEYPDVYGEPERARLVLAGGPAFTADAVLAGLRRRSEASARLNGMTGARSSHFEGGITAGGSIAFKLYLDPGWRKIQRVTLAAAAENGAAVTARVDGHAVALANGSADITGALDHTDGMPAAGAWHRIVLGCGQSTAVAADVTVRGVLAE